MAQQIDDLKVLLRQKKLFILKPPMLKYFATLGVLAGCALAGVVWSLWQIQQGTVRVGWIGLFFSAVVLLLVAYPRNWRVDRLISLIIDDHWIYLVNGPKNQALGIRRDQLVAFNKQRMPGHDGAILGFSLDLHLGAEELFQLQQQLGARQESWFEVGDQIYRIGFTCNWHGRKKLIREIGRLLEGGDDKLDELKLALSN
ncbi:hypothetical protein [Dongshaea marina]|uniref:hypothetical protein n=1 Tax=Dongshaea marina TaxID=2047966 RepID=UPI000D3E3834|nr:hypothetical protein [Dongshaea marina]